MVEAEILMLKGAAVPSQKSAFSTPLFNISNHDIQLYKTVDCRQNRPTRSIVLLDCVPLAEKTSMVAQHRYALINIPRPFKTRIFCTILTLFLL